MNNKIIINVEKIKAIATAGLSTASKNIQKFILINNLNFKSFSSVVTLQSYVKLRQVFNGGEPTYTTTAQIANALDIDMLELYKEEVAEEKLRLNRELNYVNLELSVRNYFKFDNSDICDFFLYINDKFYKNITALFINTFSFSHIMRKLRSKDKIPDAAFYKTVFFLGMYSEENYYFFCSELKKAGLSHCIIKKPKEEAAASANTMEVSESVDKESYILNSRRKEEDDSTTITNSTESLELYNLICNIPNFQDLMNTKCSKIPTSSFQGEGFYYIKNKATGKVFYAGIKMTNMGDYILRTGEYVGMKPTIVKADQIEILAKVDKISFS